GPRALAMIRRALEEGAERLLVAVHHPVGPRAKRLGDLLARDGLSRRREDRQPPHHHHRQETPHRLTPPTRQPTCPRTALQTVAHGASLRQLDALDPVELGERREPGHLDRPYDVARRHLIQAEARCLRSEEHTSELQSRRDLVCRLLLEKKNKA